MNTKNQGFMMVNALVSAGIMAIVGLAMAGLMSDMWKETSNIQNKSNEIMLGQALRAQVATPLLCAQSLVNKTGFNPGEGTRELAIRLIPTEPSSTVQSGSVLPEWGVTVKKLQLINIIKALESFGGSTIYVGDMSMLAEQNNSRKFTYKAKSLGKVFVKVSDTTHEITDCYGSDSASSIAEYTCETLGGSFDTILQRCDLRKFLASLGYCPDTQVMKGFNAQGGLYCTNLSDTDGDGIPDNGDAGDTDPETYRCTYVHNPGCPLNGPPQPPRATGCCDQHKTGSTCTYQYSTPQICGGGGGPTASFSTQTFNCTCLN